MRPHIAVLASALFCAALAVPTSAEVLIFDLGSAESALWAGAQRVTPDDPRWRSPQGLSTHDAPAQGDPVWTNALTQDAILGERANGFRFQAPSGKWRVYALCGIGGHWDRSQAQYWDFDVTVGGESWRCQMQAPEGSGPHRLESHTFAAASAGEIEVRLTPRSKWCLAGLLAWQPQDDSAARQLIRRIEQWAPDEEIAKWKADVRPPAGPSLAISASDRKQGFFVWHRHWATPIYPWTNPTADETAPVLRVFAAPGEYEPITFTVRPLRPLHRAEVKVAALGPVPAGEIEVRKVRYMKARRNYSDRGLYRMVPDILDRWQAGPLPANENATFWLTVHVPDQAKPGVYRGAIRFSADGKAAAVPVALRVLDTRLQEDPNHTYGIYYEEPLREVGRAPDEVSRRYWIRKAEMERADMVAHGTRNITLSCWSPAADENGKFDMTESFRLLDAQLKLNARFGFQPPYMVSISSESAYEKYMKTGLANHLAGVQMPPEAFFTEITAMVRAIEQERKRRGWPEFIYQPYDEPSADPPIVAFMVRLFEAVKAAGVRTYTTAAPEKPGYQPFKPVVDVWCTQPFLPDHDTAVADMKARGVAYWCYPNDISGENDHTPVAGARMTYGFGFWRSGFLRLIPWIYQYSIGDPFNYLDGSAMDFMVRSEQDGRPIPVALWEAYREGYDDMRYIYTLQQAIARGRKSPSGQVRAEAAAAQQVLDAVWNAIPVRAQYQYRGFWSPEEMDVYRWLVAERLERLTKLLRQTKQ